MKKILVVMLMILLALPALAENWKQMGTDTSGQIQIFLDLDAVSKKGELATTKQKFLYSNEERKGNYSLLEVTLKSDKTFRLDKIETFNAEGKVLDSGASDKFNPIAAGSPIETIYNEIFGK